MSLEEFQKAWKSEELQPQVTFNVELLAREVERSSEAFRSSIFRRHLGQIEAVIWIILTWCLMGYFMSPPWTWYLMIPVLLWMAIVYAVTLKQNARHPVVSGQPVLDSVKGSLSQVEHQIRLMRNLPWWNLLPTAVAMLVFFAQATWHTNLPWWARLLVIGLWALLLYVAFRWMWRMNDLSVQRELEPRRSELKRVIGNLEGENAGDEKEIRDLVSGLNANDVPLGIQEATEKGIETWNCLIPSWREVIFLVVPTLASAYCATLFQADSRRAMFIHSTRVASVNFAIALVILCVVANRRRKKHSLTQPENARYNLPAMVTLRLIMLMWTLGSLAFLTTASEPKSRPIDKPNMLAEPDSDNR